jgi:hypothetical protein
MTQFDTSLRSTASKLLSKFGKLVTLTRRTESYAPSTGELTVISVTATIRAVVGTYSKFLYGTSSILVGDLKLTVAAADFTFDPAPNDTVLIDSVLYKVVRADPVYISEQPGLWELQVRK